MFSKPLARSGSLKMNWLNRTEQLWVFCFLLVKIIFFCCCCCWCCYPSFCEVIGLVSICQPSRDRSKRCQLFSEWSRQTLHRFNLTVSSGQHPLINDAGNKSKLTMMNCCQSTHPSVHGWMDGSQTGIHGRVNLVNVTLRTSSLVKLLFSWIVAWIQPIDRRCTPLPQVK